MGISSANYVPLPGMLLIHNLIYFTSETPRKYFKQMEYSLSCRTTIYRGRLHNNVLTIK
jgi:hypothetical protein